MEWLIGAYPDESSLVSALERAKADGRPDFVLLRSAHAEACEQQHLRPVQH